MNNRVVDCISDEYDMRVVSHTCLRFDLSRWEQHAEEEEGLAALRDVRTQESMNRCHSVRVTAPRSTRNEQFLRSHFEFGLGPTQAIPPHCHRVRRSNLPTFEFPAYDEQQ
jgi:hypothetical protein